MSDNYQRGDLLPCRWTPLGGAAVVLNITGYGIALESLSLDVTGTRHGGKRARFGGTEDSKGNITAFLDLDNAPWPALNPGIRNGALGILEPFVITDRSKAFVIPILIPRVNYKSAMQEALSWNFDYELSVLAGTFAYPQ